MYLESVDFRILIKDHLTEQDDDFSLLFKFINHFNSQPSIKDYYAKIIFLLKDLAKSFFISGYEEVEAHFEFKIQPNPFDEKNYKECDTGIFMSKLMKFLDEKIYDENRKLEKVPRTNAYKDGMVGKKITLEEFIATLEIKNNIKKETLAENSPKDGGARKKFKLDFNVNNIIGQTIPVD